MTFRQIEKSSLAIYAKKPTKNDCFYPIMCLSGKNSKFWFQGVLRIILLHNHERLLRNPNETEGGVPKTVNSPFLGAAAHLGPQIKISKKNVWRYLPYEDILNVSRKSDNFRIFALFGACGPFRAAQFWPQIKILAPRDFACYPSAQS
jgi:hypothetical protein